MVGFVLLTGIVERESNQYRATCLELGTATCADTPEEARSNLDEAVQLEIDVLEELGERVWVFKEKGIKVWGVGDDRVPYLEIPVRLHPLVGTEPVKAWVLCPAVAVA